MTLQIISQFIIRKNVHIVMCMSDSWRGFGLDIRFIDHFNIQLIITLNYSAITDIHTLQVTVTHTLVSSVCY
jgi:hypothetical protein